MPRDETLLERSRHLAAIEAALEEAQASGHGRAVLVGGEAGVGKTVLLRRFCDARERPTRILWGACDALFTPRPLGPLLDVAKAAGGDLEELVRAGARPHEVAGALIAELAASTPTVLVLDDLHWADEATLDVLTLVGRRIGAVPALVLAAYRDDELDRTHPLRMVLGELATAGGISRLAVEPLSPEAVATLAEPFRVDADELFDKTGGNPFFVTEVLAAAEKEIPPTVRDTVLARAARLSPEGRRVLEAVAVVPQQAELWLLEALAGESLDRLDEGLASGILTAAEGAVRFRHELARLAVEESLSPTRRVSLHRNALAALAEPPQGRPDLARLAHHAEAAGDVDSVLEYAPAAAAQAASVGALREAADQYGRALRFAGGAAPARLGELLERRSYACYLTGEFGEAIEAQGRALDCYRQAGDRLKEGDSLRVLSRLFRYVGRPADAARAVQEAVAKLEETLALAREAGLEEHAGRIYVAFVWWAPRGRSYAFADRYLREGLEYCAEHGIDLWRLYLLAYRARAELDRGRWDEAAETAQVVIRNPRSSPVPRIVALSVLGLVRARRGDPDVWPLLDEAWELAEPTGELQRLEPAAAARAEAAWLAGQPEAVGEMTESTLRLARDRGAQWIVSELSYWRRQAGRDDEIPAGAGDPYSLQMAGDPLRAAELWEELDSPYEAALALVDADDDDSVRRGLDELQRLGARPTAAIVARRLRERGARGLPRGPRATTQANPAGLTARELEVLALLADGLRNAEIADRLVLSQKTVDHHVSAILRKLGVRSRGQAAAEAARRGLLPR